MPRGNKPRVEPAIAAALQKKSNLSDVDLARICFCVRRSAARILFEFHKEGLVHISGIARPDLEPDELTEPDRGFVFLGDRVGNIVRLRAMVDAGYNGFVSMEPFSPETQNDPKLAERLRASLDYVKGAARLG